jgi:hypothetical protein
MDAYWLLKDSLIKCEEQIYVFDLKGWIINEKIMNQWDSNIRAFILA